MEEFFAELDGTGDAGRFRHLRDLLNAELPDVLVFRFGSVRLDVYLIGRSRGGDWAGLHATSVET